MSDVHVNPKIDPQLGPVEALGVALSIPMSNTEMMKCQELAKPMLAHLARLGWFLVSDKTYDAVRAELARLQAIVAGEPERMLEMTRKLMREGPELAKVRDEIRLRSEVLRVFDADMNDVPNYAAAEVIEQMKRMLWLLRRERELMGEEWVTSG